jgi:hypothetical protein
MKTKNKKIKEIGGALLVLLEYPWWIQMCLSGFVIELLSFQ